MIERIPDVRWDEICHFTRPEFETVEWLTSGTTRGGALRKVDGYDILTVREGKIAAKRSSRESIV
jgi:hypothetical protein